MLKRLVCLAMMAALCTVAAVADGDPPPPPKHKCPTYCGGSGPQAPASVNQSEPGRYGG